MTNERREARVALLLAMLMVGACTNPAVTAFPSSTQAAVPTAATSAPSATRGPAIGDLVDVRGEPIDPASLRGRIAFADGTDDVYTVNADGSGLLRLTNDPALEFDPTWSPDGTSIAYRHQSGDDATTDIFVMDADGSNPRNLSGSDATGDWGPDWSADGEWIAWNTASAGHIFDLGLIHADGSGRRVIKPGIYIEYPAWSPDRRRIAFMSPGDGSAYDIYVMNADGTDVRNLTNSADVEGWPAWSPDGRQIVFTTERDDCRRSTSADCLTSGDIGPWHTLYVMNADGTGQRRLTRTFGQFAVWSPDGQYILFAPFLNVIRADGTGLIRLPVEGAPAEPEMPDWIGA
jgi:Tol biopolymer transport system component